MHLTIEKEISRSSYHYCIGAARFCISVALLSAYDTLEKLQYNVRYIYVLYASYDTWLSDQELEKLMCIVDTWNKFVPVYNETSKVFNRRKESEEAEKELLHLETVWNTYHKNLLKCCNEVLELYN